MTVSPTARESIRRLRPSMLLTALAVVLLVVAAATLRHAPAEIAAAVIVLLAVLAGIGIGASVDAHSSSTRRR